MTNSKKLQAPVEPGSIWTKADFRAINLRNLFFYQLGWGYERMQATGYLFLIAPQLKKLYGDDPAKLKSAFELEAQYFNTSPFFNTIITGLDLAAQEKEGTAAFEEVAAMKTGLMGSFASIGDSLFVALIPTVFGAIAASLAFQGNPTGIFIWIAVAIATMVFRWGQLRLAYKEGTKIVGHFSKQLGPLTDAAMVLGIFMVGALIAFVIPVHLPTVSLGGGAATLSLQNIIDSVMPCLLPAAIVAAIYAMLGVKKMTSTKAILIVLVVSVALGALGWLVV